MQINIGASLGRYEIQSAIGSGGMGEVYLAQDRQLERAVALKILPSASADDEQRMARFLREARAAARLNHANIAHVYEVGETGGVNFMAMEYVDGETLRQRLAWEKLELTEVVDIAVQVTAALVEAHAGGVVHRDIKPENIMLRGNMVKVLDFGLAKFTDRFPLRSASEYENTTIVQTEPNLVMGTANYMSPEQTRGLIVDARTDLFSLGVVIYEMASGQNPFSAQTSSDVIAAVLQFDPAPLCELCPEVPPELSWIVTKALRKDRDERYQSAKELLSDLQQLRQRLQTKEVQSKSRTLSFAAQANPVSGAEYLVSSIQNHPGRFALTTIAVLAALGAIAFGVLAWLPKETAVGPRARVLPLTNNGRASSAAVSPDGKYVAFVQKDTNGESLRVKHIPSMSETQVVAPAGEIALNGTAFSPDGSFLYYVASTNEQTELVQVPILGGAPKRVLTNLFPQPISFAPDGKRFVFTRHDAAQQEGLLVSSLADGTDQQVIARRRSPNEIAYPSWSPDGRSIAFAVINFDQQSFFWDVHEFDLTQGKERKLGSHQWWWIGGIAWLSDKSGLVLSAREIKAPLSPVWRLSYPEGHVEMVTHDTNFYAGLSVTADAKHLVVERGELRSNIWVATSPDNLSQITASKDDGSTGLGWTPDGRLVFATRGPNSGETWIMSADGSNKSLVAAVLGYELSVSPDGRYIVHSSIQSGSFNIWRMGLDGGNPVRLWEGSAHFSPTVSPDGRTLIFTKGVFDQAATWKMSIDGENAVQLTGPPSYAPAISPDGKFYAYLFRETTPTPGWKLHVREMETNNLVHSFGLPSGINSSNLGWTPDGQALSFINTVGGVSNIWNQKLAGGPPTAVTDFKSELIWRFDWSRDGRLALSRGDMVSDIVLVSNFR